MESTTPSNGDILEMVELKKKKNSSLGVHNIVLRRGDG